MTTPEDSWAPPPFAAPARAARRPLDILGLVGVVVAALALLPALLVLAIGFVPEMNAIWWLGIVLIPLLAIAGAIALVLGAVGIPVALRRRGGYALSIVAIALGLVALLPLGWLWLSSLG
jgi:hypothetical protein